MYTNSKSRLNSRSLTFWVSMTAFALIVITAAQASSQIPVIAYTTTNYSTMALNVFGSDFGTAIGTVTLGDYKLAVQTWAAGEIVATIPSTIIPGSYVLVVKTPTRPLPLLAVSVVTLGTSGPQGPIGPQGPQGITGAQGPIGPQGLTGSSGPQGVPGPPGAMGPQGPQGVPGPAGSAGANGTNGTGFNFTGPFSTVVSYNAYDVATYNGSTYVATVAIPSGNLTPDGNPSWSLMVQEGAVGPSGVQGLPGPPGPSTPGPQGPQGPAGVAGPAGPGGYNGVQLFVASGIWTAPANIQNVVVELIGAGGAGGGGYIDPAIAGGIGGGGAYTKAFVSVTPGQTYAIVVGQGGTGTGSALGRPGGASDFEDGQNTVLAFANGGHGGDILGTPGAGGSSTGNPALFAAPGIIGSTGNGVSFVPRATQYGAGGAGGAGGGIDPGSTGGNGAVLIWW